MSMTAEQRDRWNAAVYAASTNPGPETTAAREAVRDECLDAIFGPIIAEDMAKQAGAR